MDIKSIKGWFVRLFTVIYSYYYQLVRLLVYFLSNFNVYISTLNINNILISTLKIHKHIFKWLQNSYKHFSSQFNLYQFYSVDRNSYNSLLNSLKTAKCNEINTKIILKKYETFQNLYVIYYSELYTSTNFDIF